MKGTKEIAEIILGIGPRHAGHYQAENRKLAQAYIDLRAATIDVADIYAKRGIVPIAFEHRVEELLKLVKDT